MKFQLIYLNKVTALHQAVIDGNEEMVKLFLGHPNINVNMNAVFLKSIFFLISFHIIFFKILFEINILNRIQNQIF